MSVPLIHELFERQAERTPDATALIFGDQRVNYAELNRRSNQLAHRLQKAGVGPEVYVGVCLERSIDAVIALLGTLKAGGAYVYFDPNLPDRRMEDQRKDSQPRLMVTNRGFESRFGRGLVYVDICSTDLSGEDTTNLSVEVTPNNAAYVLYTSGSTGSPKGIIEIHQSLTARLTSGALPDIRAADICCLNSSLGFGITTSRLFLPLVCGSSVVILPDADVKDTRRFIHALQTHRITSLFVPPALLRTLLELDPATLAGAAGIRAVTVTGSALTARLVESFFTALPSAQLVNVYGSAEIGTTATLRALDRNSEVLEGSIGKPVANTRVHLLDQDGFPVAGDAVGEIFVEAAHLARGYLNQPSVTREKFMPSPSSPEGRLYRTGDMGRFLPSGDIQFLGRRDHQVKIRGFRVELGEVEARLEELKGITEAVVTAIGTAETETRLIAYFVSKGGVNPQGIRVFLEDRLPRYMIPTAFVRLARLPRTLSGKVDRAALPPCGPARPEVESIHEAPRNLVETGIAQIWSDILRVKDVGVYDNFVELGGDSLAGNQVIFRIRDRFRIELTLETLFEQTIAEIALRYVPGEFL